jgi:RNA polymerase sigma-70 factor (ECF subfamily)
MITNDPLAEYRSLLFAIAYRMLGSVMDAEDIVQEAYLRWQQVDPETVRSARSYLTATVTHLCIDQLRAARDKREAYVGPWLPEPLIGPQAPDSADSVALAESLSLAFLVLLERLTPLERAVFLLHDIFAYTFEEIAAFVDKTPSNCRQIAHRARQSVRQGRPRFTASSEEQARLTERFAVACKEGDLGGLMVLLSNEITLWTDGGGVVHAARNPIHGPNAVARFLLGVLGKLPAGFTARFDRVNGRPGILTEQDGQLTGALSLDIADGQIQGIYLMVNPEKLYLIQFSEQIIAERS